MAYCSIMSKVMPTFGGPDGLFGCGQEGVEFLDRDIIVCCWDDIKFQPKSGGSLQKVSSSRIPFVREHIYVAKDTLDSLCITEWPYLLSKIAGTEWCSWVLSASFMQCMQMRYWKAGILQMQIRSWVVDILKIYVFKYRCLWACAPCVWPEFYSLKCIGHILLFSLFHHKMSYSIYLNNINKVIMCMHFSITCNFQRWKSISLKKKEKEK